MGSLETPGEWKMTRDGGFIVIHRDTIPRKEIISPESTRNSRIGGRRGFSRTGAALGFAEATSEAKRMDSR
jgi:hypothetical protein